VVSRKLIAGVVAGALVVSALSALAVIFRPDRAISVATGFVAHNLCSMIFVSGLDPQTGFAETTDRAGIRLVRWGLKFRLDRAGTLMHPWRGYSAAMRHFMKDSAASCSADALHPIFSRATSTR
jgi:hypothetical protein